jgi:hypothetical protein
VSQAFDFPNLGCATCGYAMQSLGRFEGGKVVVACSGFHCPEFGIQRKYVVAPIDLLELEDGDTAAPLERESAELEAEKPVETDPVVEEPETPVLEGVE